jgi:hypothetical protein
MPPLFRGRPTKPEFVTPPAEPSGDELIAAATPEASPWEREAISEIWFAIERAFKEEARRGVGRNAGRLDLAMEIRNILVPPKPVPAAHGGTS